MKTGTAIQAALAFLLELGLLGAAGLWALTVFGTVWAAVLAVVVVAAVWGLLLSPKAPARPPWPWHAVAGHALFGLGAGVLLVIGRPLVGGILLALALVSVVLMVRFRADLAAESVRAREERPRRHAAVVPGERGWPLPSAPRTGRLSGPAVAARPPGAEHG